MRRERSQSITLKVFLRSCVGGLLVIFPRVIFLRVIFPRVIFLLVIFGFPGISHGERSDPLDPFDMSLPSWGVPDTQEDSAKTPNQLVQEATQLLMDERPLDARSKLLLALKKDPNSFRVHFMLGNYYLTQVGHFRLALKYVKRAQELLYEQKGQPPYADYRTQSDHALLLYLLSQVRLNLDNYQGALDALDEYSKYRYYDEWYPGSRAWILMKLGRLPEAIKVAKMGLLTMTRDTEKGQILNMLGILFSMTKQRSESLEIFRRAIAQEYAMDKLGQPATPLNNAGEVYKEVFEEDRAEEAWLRATSMKDGCEHVLPSLNLALLYTEELNLRGAKEAMDKFEGCVAQYPLRNGEEHRALVHLARGRIALLAGNVDDAIKHYEGTLERQQWFGKIGASIEDLQSAATMSLAQAYRRKALVLSHTPVKSVLEIPTEWGRSLEASSKAWWYMRRARKILLGDLNDFEDLYARNTDSLLEYPTLGELTVDLPAPQIEARLTSLSKNEDRPKARLFYKAYQAEHLASEGKITDAFKLFDQVLTEARPKYDNLLVVHTLLTKASYIPKDSAAYGETVTKAFELSRPSVRNYGAQLPVNFTIADSRIKSAFHDSPFLLDNKDKLQYVLVAENHEGGYSLQLFSLKGSLGTIKVTGKDLPEAVQKLSDEVFTIGLES